jgi:hypothetical protein
VTQGCHPVRHTHRSEYMPAMPRFHGTVLVIALLVAYSAWVSIGDVARLCLMVLLDRTGIGRRHFFHPRKAHLSVNRQTVLGIC